MKAKQNKKAGVVSNGLEPVKLKTSVVDLVRKNKQETGVNIGFFFEEAALEKLRKKKLK